MTRLHVTLLCNSKPSLSWSFYLHFYLGIHCLYKFQTVFYGSDRIREDYLFFLWFLMFCLLNLCNNLHINLHIKYSIWVACLQLFARILYSWTFWIDCQRCTLIFISRICNRLIQNKICQNFYPESSLKWYAVIWRWLFSMINRFRQWKL